MSLDLARLEKARLVGDKLIARCPACAEQGADRSGEHLFVADQGRGAFGCIAHRDDHEHRQRIFELAGVRSGCPAARFPVPLAAPQPTAKPSPRIPPLRPLTVGEMAGVARLRSWPLFAGLQLLANRGLLFFGEVWDGGRDWPAWIITDSSRRNAQARRMDGKPWDGIGGKKAKSLPGTDPSWPIGVPEIGARPVVVLCEGQPDFCAAFLVAWAEEIGPDMIAPVCITGAGNRIHPDALPAFRGKHVRIAMHNDAEGRSAAERWAAQLHEAGANTVDAFDFDGLATTEGRPVEDLAAYATLIDPEQPPSPRAFARIGGGGTKQQTIPENTPILP